MMKKHDLYLKIINELEDHAFKVKDLRKEYITWKITQHSNPDYKTYGLKASEIKDQIKKYNHRFNQLNLEEKYYLARKFFESGYGEQATFGISLIEMSLKEINPKFFFRFDEFLSYFNNWATTDWFCFRVIQPLLNKYPNEMLKLLKKWNLSENIWKRRASLVSFTKRIAFKEEFIDQIFHLCDNLIWDEEELVRKAIGWVLRDNMYIAKKRIIEYIKILRRKGVSSKIISNAIQNLSSEERTNILKTSQFQSFQTN